MKSIRINFIAAIILLFAGIGSAAAQTDIAEVKIRTSAVCDMCKTTLEKSLAFEKGVKRSTLDVESKIITVQYNPQKTDVDKIRKAISKAGYDADDVPADPKAYKKLDSCCKKGQTCDEKK